MDNVKIFTGFPKKSLHKIKKKVSINTIQWHLP